MNNDLIMLEQPAIIKQRLAQLKQRWEQMAAEADAMVCTEETIQAVKKFRADMRKEFAEVDEQRKRIKKAVVAPYEAFEEVYKTLVKDAFYNADETLWIKIDSIESDIKSRCEMALREYFYELCAAHHVEWLKFEQAGIKIDMSSAKQKTPKKLREQLVCFVVRVASDVETISTTEHADEILAEYKPCLNLSKSIGTVLDRHRRIEEERKYIEAYDRMIAKDSEVIARIDALAPPTIVKPPERDPDEVVENVPFKIVKATRRQIWRLKEFMDKEGIIYE